MELAPTEWVRESWTRIRQWRNCSDLRRQVSDLEAKVHHLAAENDRMQRYLNVTEVILVALDDQGIVTDINQKGCQVLEYDDLEVIGKY